MGFQATSDRLYSSPGILLVIPPDVQTHSETIPFLLFHVVFIQMMSLTTLPFTCLHLRYPFFVQTCPTASCWGLMREVGGQMIPLRKRANQRLRGYHRITSLASQASLPRHHLRSSASLHFYPVRLQLVSLEDFSPWPQSCISSDSYRSYVCLQRAISRSGL